MGNPLIELAKHGQSVWLDNINREILINGRLTELINNYNVTGVTSNPAIFQKAMSTGSYYDEQIIKCLTDNPVITPVRASVILVTFPCFLISSTLAVPIAPTTLCFF